MKLFKISDGALAVLASIPGPFSGPPKVFQDGKFSARAQVSVTLRDATGRTGIFAVLKTLERSVTLDIRGGDGVSLVEAVRVDEAQVSELPLSELLEAADCNEIRLKILRLLIQDCVSSLQLSGSPGFDAIRAQAIQQVQAYAIQLPALGRLMLPPRFCLWTFADPGVGEIQVTQVLDPDRSKVRSSPFKPIRAVGLVLPASAGGARDVLVESIDEAAKSLELLLWASDGRVYRVGTRDIPTLSASDLVSLLRQRQDGGLDLFGYLASVLGPYLTSYPVYAQLMREARVLVPPRPRVYLESAHQIGAGVDIALVTSDGDLLVSGWMFDPLGLIETVCWIDPSGVRLSILEHASRIYPRTLPERYCKDPHGDRAYGFVSRLRTSGAAAMLPQHRLEVWFKSGARAKLIARHAPLMPNDARDAVLGIVSEDEMLRDDVWEKLSGVVATFHRQHLVGPRVAKEMEIGDPPVRPRNSIVIPLYKTLEFIRYQFAAFAIDRDFSTTELIFVLDSPEQSEDVEMRLRAMSGLYGIPLRLIVHEKNLGFAPATNTGASRSRGAVLILLNSDIIPRSPGWIRSMRNRLKGDVGMVGPKLLFHDDSIQHAGMDFAQDLKGQYFNQHPYKGYPSRFPPANVPRVVPALTGACLMLRRDVFEKCGGICEDYIIGDFEDSDFSHRVSALGMKLFYEPDAELYHYERQSVAKHDTYTKTTAGAYNRKLHDVRWRGMERGGEG